MFGTVTCARKNQAIGLVSTEKMWGMIRMETYEKVNVRQKMKIKLSYDVREDPWIDSLSGYIRV